MAYMEYRDPNVSCPKDAIKLNHSLNRMPANVFLCGQLQPLTLLRIIPTSGKFKQVTFITGFSNTVNALAGHFNCSDLLEISSCIPVKCCPSQIRSLTWVRAITVLGMLQWLMRNSK